MLFSVHISFFYVKERFQYLNRVINEINGYDYTTDIFIHTNRMFSKSELPEYKNGKIEIIVHHDLLDPYFLTWKHRSLMRDQMKMYDVFMYVEDDILISNKSIEYWLQNKDVLIKHGYNLGFMRIEIDDSGKQYTSDIYNGEHLSEIVEIENRNYVVNDIRWAYCGFWIYDKKEFERFVNLRHVYKLKWKYKGGIREKAAMGMSSFYKSTVIPLDDNQMHIGSKVYHLPNNYIKTGQLNTYINILQNIS